MSEEKEIISYISLGKKELGRKIFIQYTDDELETLVRCKYSVYSYSKIYIIEIIEITTDLVKLFFKVHPIFRSKNSVVIGLYSKLDIIIAFSLPTDKSEDVQNLLADKHAKWELQHGKKSADYLKIWHAFCVIVHHHSARITKVFGGLAALLGIKWIKDAVARFLG